MMSRCRCRRAPVIGRRGATPSSTAMRRRTRSTSMAGGTSAPRRAYRSRRRNARPWASCNAGGVWSARWSTPTSPRKIGRSSRGPWNRPMPATRPAWRRSRRMRSTARRRTRRRSIMARRRTTRRRSTGRRSTRTGRTTRVSIRRRPRPSNWLVSAARRPPWASSRSWGWSPRFWASRSRPGAAAAVARASSATASWSTRRPSHLPDAPCEGGCGVRRATRSRPVGDWAAAGMLGRPSSARRIGGAASSAP
mmetsp:Transcript_73468/g.212604  ORF Transcript_73468/g.212604 Transcript_73468/m.212604 type:complete len:251 (+) Transcript_73468:404-1156(+)